MDASSSPSPSSRKRDDLGNDDETLSVAAMAENFFPAEVIRKKPHPIQAKVWYYLNSTAALLFVYLEGQNAEQADYIWPRFTRKQVRPIQSSATHLQLSVPISCHKRQKEGIFSSSIVIYTRYWCCFTNCLDYYSIGFSLSSLVTTKLAYLILRDEESGRTLGVLLQRFNVTATTKTTSIPIYALQEVVFTKG